MSAHFYEDPNLTVKYSKGFPEDRGERVEKVVNIYESANTLREHHGDLSAADGAAQKPPPAVQQNPFKTAAFILGLLCLLLLVGITIVSKLYIPVVLEKEKLSVSYNHLQSSYDTLSNDYCQKENHTQGNAAGWTRFRCSCYYKSTAVKNWTESRADCESRGADLVVINSKEEQEIVSKMSKRQESWIGLQSKRRRSWEETRVWKWVDGSTPTYIAWQVEVNINAEEGSTVYIDLQGKWSHTKNGSKAWICEKQI